MFLPTEHYPFTLKPLPYTYDALEPFIDAETMQLHHNKHLKAYVDKLNQALEAYPKYQLWTLKRLLCSIHLLPIELQNNIRNNGGGVYNHNFFFSIMAPPNMTCPSERFLQLTESCFRNLEAFQEKFKEAALGQFSSGYAWAVLDAYGNLCILTTSNQDTPLLKNVCPLFLLDVWEHAYYLKYQNRRNEYIDSWWNVINWDEVDKNISNCKRKIW